MGVGVVQNTDRLFAVLVVLSGIGSTVLMAITLFSFWVRARGVRRCPSWWWCARRGDDV